MVASLRRYVKRHNKLLQCYGDSQVITEFPAGKRGRPLLLGSELDDKVITSLKTLRSAGDIINKPITMATYD